MAADRTESEQGIEFDYCCCHAAFALKEDGFETIMVNCNPETVSTDYDTADRLYFEPLTLEDVLAILHREKPQGVIVQFGGQTPLNLALDLKRNGAKIIGTDPESIDLAEDRRRFGANFSSWMNIPAASRAAGTALTPEEAVKVAEEIGLPVLVRPSYVLGGRSMVIAYDPEKPCRELCDSSGVGWHGGRSRNALSLIDQFNGGARPKWMWTRLRMAKTW